MKKRRQQSGPGLSGARRSSAGRGASGGRQPTGGAGSVRIIAGQWRGRKLSVASVPGLRPTGDRIRETLFSWLQFELPGTHCLDLFAGSGALGFEAASRGAAAVTMIESNTVAYHALAAHVTTLGAGSVNVINEDALAYLESRGRPEENDMATSFQGVFVDPPFQQSLHQPILDRLANSGKLAENAWVYIESATNEHYTLPASMESVRHSTAGNVHFRLVRFNGG